MQSNTSVGFVKIFSFENYISIEELYKFKYLAHCKEDCSVENAISCSLQSEA